MAILKEGINGPFSGKVGSIVGYQLNGQNIIRGLPSVVIRKPTALTLINRGRMKAVSQFLSPIKRVIDVGYKNIAPKGSRVGTFQTAQSYTFKNAIDYHENTVPYVNPEKVLVFRGSLMPPPHLEVRRDGRMLYLTWDKDMCRGIQASLVALAYDPERNDLCFEESGAKASQGEYAWDIGVNSSIYTSPHIHVYVGFYDMVGDEFSDSVYGGCV